jgi:hypothetical protein
MKADLSCRPFEFSDYDLVCEWWRGHKRAPIPVTFLPACGFIAEDSSGPLAAVWLFFETSTPICFIGQAVTRPKLMLGEAVAALLALVKESKRQAVLSGALVMMAYLPKGMARYLPDFMEEQRSLANLATVLEEEDLCLG